MLPVPWDFASYGALFLKYFLLPSIIQDYMIIRMIIQDYMLIHMESRTNTILAWLSVQSAPDQKSRCGTIFKL